MTKIDIYSGFLGAGKTTLIKKLISDCYSGEKLVLIENEFGEIGIDGGFLQDAGIEITEMNSGCICCSLVGDFRTALSKVIDEYKPDRIVIEPSGVGKLSDVIKAVESIADENVILNAFTTVVDAGKCKMYMKNFGEFFNDQIEHAGTIIMSHSDIVKEEKLNAAVELVREKNATAVIVTTPVAQLEPDVLVSAIERKDTLEAVIKSMHSEQKHHHHHHDEDCDCGCHDHEHHHHHEEECDCGCHEHDHEHHHQHDEECDCGCHDHDHEHHHHHHADEVFVNWGRETPKKFDRAALEAILAELAREDGEGGMVLRAKGILQSTDGSWMQFDLTPGEYEIREGSASYTGLLCVIGTGLDEDKLTALFGV